MQGTEKKLVLGQKALRCNTNETCCSNLKQIYCVEEDKEGENETPAPSLMENSVMFFFLMQRFVILMDNT